MFERFRGSVLIASASVFCGCWLSGPIAGDDADQPLNPEDCVPRTWIGDVLVETTADLAEISSYTEITGSLVIYQTEIAELESVACLARVGGSLMVRYNERLTTLDGLRSLRWVGGSAYVSYNDEIDDLAGLSNLERVEGDLEIWHNPLLTDLRGLWALRTVAGDLNIQQNDSLRRLEGVPQLAGVGEFINISYNPALPPCRASDFVDRLREAGWEGTATTIDNLGDPDDCPD